MKKLFYLIGALVTAISVFALIAVLLKKLKISLSIEGISDEDDDGLCDCEDCSCDDDGITVTIHPDEHEDESDIKVEFVEDDEVKAEKSTEKVEINPEFEEEIRNAEVSEEKTDKNPKKASKQD